MPGLELDDEMANAVRKMPRDCRWSQDKVKVNFEFNLDPVASQKLNIDQVRRMIILPLKPIKNWFGTVSVSTRLRDVEHFGSGILGRVP